MTDDTLFKNYKFCAQCRKPLSLSYPDDICPDCKERQLFNEVKEYIRSNVVNEYQVCEHFHLSHHKVREWIREGRIEYVKNGDQVVMISLHCKNCGAPITFGSLCSKCLKKQNTQRGHAYAAPSKEGDNRMHFLDSEKTNLP